MTEPLVAVLLATMLVLAVIAVRAADLLLAVIVLGAYGFTMSLVWSAIGAVDVAYTEAVVGAGVGTVLFRAALLRTSRRRSPLPSPLRWLALAVVIPVGALLLLVVQPLPRWGDPASPPAVHVSRTETVHRPGSTGARRSQIQRAITSLVGFSRPSISLR